MVETRENVYDGTLDCSNPTFSESVKDGNN